MNSRGVSLWRVQHVIDAVCAVRLTDRLTGLMGADGSCLHKYSK